MAEHASGTVAAAVRAAAAHLAHTSDTPRLDAELLMAHALGTDRSDMLLRHARDAAPDGFEALVRRRGANEPVAYIVGRQEFFGRVFAVDRSVLIPRADSETVIEAALDACPDPRRVLDCGTGSGALLLTLLAERPASRGVGIDASCAAIETARGNARKLGLADRAEVLRADWREEGWAAGLGRFDLVLANPPYVEADAPLAGDVRDWEPGEALFAGPDGLEAYRCLVPQLPRLLAPGGVAVVEIGATQATPVTALAREAGFEAAVRRDLGGRDRAVTMRETGAVKGD